MLGLPDRMEVSENEVLVTNTLSLNRTLPYILHGTHWYCKNMCVLYLFLPLSQSLDVPSLSLFLSLLPLPVSSSLSSVSVCFPLSLSLFPPLCLFSVSLSEYVSLSAMSLGLTAAFCLSVFLST